MKSTLVAFLVLASLPFSVIVNLLCIIYIKYTYYFYIPYLTWCMLGAKAHKNGGAGNLSFRTGSFWKTYAKYYPMKIRKKEEKIVYPVDRPLLIGYHPHGIYSLGCSGQFAAHGSNFLDIFPGVNAHPVTVNFLIKMPFFREVLLPLGAISSDYESIECALQKGSGNAVVIVPGGANEATKACKNTHRLVLNKRKGLFYCALKFGVALIPAYSFGENNTYSVYHPGKNSWLSCLSDLTRKHFGFSLPIFIGRVGFLGIAPHATPINTVTGSPILCAKIAEPTDADIAKLRKKYCDELKDIFNKYKKEYCEDPANEELIFVE